MRIIQVIKGLGLGGAERHVVDVAIGLKALGYKTSVAYLIPEKDAMVKELRSNGIDVYCLGYSGFIGRMMCLFKFLALCAKLKPDVVHAHLPVAGLIARAAKIRFGYRGIYTEHNVQQRLTYFSRISQRLTSWIDDVTVSCSEGVARSLSRASLVISNGIAVPTPSQIEKYRAGARHQFGIPADAVVALCVANLLPKKNHELLLRAWARVVKKGTLRLDNRLLLLVGQDGSERQKLEKLAEILGVGPTVRFVGAQADVKPFMAMSDLYCMSSDFEGLPIALLEAMSFGLPTLVTDAGGMGDVVNSAQCGFVVRVGDESALVLRLEELLANGDARTAYGAAARAAVEKDYGIDDCVRKLDLIYRQGT